MIPCGVFRECARARSATIGRRDEKSCRWVQIDDVNGPPASRGGWLVKCECVHVEERRIEMRRDGGENKNTIRMYILPRLLGFFLCLSTVCSCYRSYDFLMPVDDDV